MDVFLVPVASDRYELYCEEPDDPEEPDQEPPQGFFRRMAKRVREALAEAERERHRDEPNPADAHPTFFGRMKARTLRWAATWIAEQRLLWQMRGKEAAQLLYPSDITEAQARELLRRSMQSDWERHRFWLAIDSLGLVASGALILFPGPNFVGYYFLVRTVGHYFSLRGARQALAVVTWSVQPKSELTELRALAGQSPDAREDRVRAIAECLGLERFASFFQRSAIP